MQKVRSTLYFYELSWRKLEFSAGRWKYRWIKWEQVDEVEEKMKESSLAFHSHLMMIVMLYYLTYNWIYERWNHSKRMNLSKFFSYRTNFFFVPANTHRCKRLYMQCAPFHIKLPTLFRSMHRINCSIEFIVHNTKQ